MISSESDVALMTRVRDGDTDAFRELIERHQRAVINTIHRAIGDAWEAEDAPGFLPMPLQYLATAEAQRRIGRSNNREFVGIPVGQIVGSMNEVRPVKDVIFQLVEEFIDASERVAKLGRE